jgi:hypothetical protein
MCWSTPYGAKVVAWAREYRQRLWKWVRHCVLGGASGDVNPRPFGGESALEKS